MAKLYHWESWERFKDYSPGDIFVMADSVDEARRKALAKYDEECSYDRDKLEVDLAAEPEVVDVCFVHGGG